jgi:hypothetical protein
MGSRSLIGYIKWHLVVNDGKEVAGAHSPIFSVIVIFLHCSEEVRKVAKLLT